MDGLRVLKMFFQAVHFSSLHQPTQTSETYIPRSTPPLEVLKMRISPSYIIPVLGFVVQALGDGASCLCPEIESPVLTTYLGTVVPFERLSKNDSVSYTFLDALHVYMRTPPLTKKK